MTSLKLRFNADYRMTELIEFETDRLHLRQWQVADRDPFAALNSDPRVMEFFPSPLTRAESDAMADRCESLIHERGWGFWAAELKTNGSFIGFVGLHTRPPNSHFHLASRSVGVLRMSTGEKGWRRKQQGEQFVSASNHSA